MSILSFEIVAFLIGVVIQCMVLCVIMIKIERIEATLLKMQANELERLIAERTKDKP